MEHKYAGDFPTAKEIYNALMKSDAKYIPPTVEMDFSEELKKQKKRIEGEDVEEIILEWKTEMERCKDFTYWYQVYYKSIV